MLSCQPRCLCLGDTRPGCAAKAGQVAMSDAQMRQDDDLRHTPCQVVRSGGYPELNRSLVLLGAAEVLDESSCTTDSDGQHT